ncbi:MAG TPA: hypothetical protein VF399_03635 [bacterium]
MARCWQAVGTAVVLLSLLTCAHKAAPLSKDRLKPRLQKIASLNDRQILLTFSEEIDTSSLKIGNIAIASQDDTSETLAVITLYPSLSASEIIAVTARQDVKTYRVSGLVVDYGQNTGTFKKTFVGSNRPDTVRPWLASYTRGYKNSVFRMQFAKAMDTTSSSLRFRILPKKSLDPLWSDYRHLALTPRSADDSLRYDTTYYCYFTTASDLSGNTILPFIISITPDSLYKPFVLKGKAVIDDSTALLDGLAILKRSLPVAIARLNKGEFSFEVRDSSEYTILIIATGMMGEAPVSLSEKNIVPLRPEQCDIDTIID